MMINGSFGKRVLVDVLVDGHPPSVNHIWQIVGKRMYKTAKARQFQQLMAAILCANKTQGIVSEKKVEVSIVLGVNDRRRFDIDNKIKICLDALMDAGVIKDDSQVDSLSISRQYGTEKFTQINVCEIASAGDY